MIKPYTLCIVAAALLSTYAHADEVKQPLPKSIEAMVGDDTQRAIKRIAHRMLELQPDGIITQEVIDNYIKSAVAQNRAQVMQGILSLDLDFDGVLSEEELDIARLSSQSRRMIKRSDLELMIIDADLDANNQLDFDELRQHVVRTVQTDANRRLPRREQFVVDLMALDMDGDGVVTIQEMAKVLRAR